MKPLECFGNRVGNGIALQLYHNGHHGYSFGQPRLLLPYPGAAGLLHHHLPDIATGYKDGLCKIIHT